MSKKKKSKNKYISGWGSAIKNTRKKEKKNGIKNCNRGIFVYIMDNWVMLLVLLFKIGVIGAVIVIFCLGKFEWGMTILSSSLFILSLLNTIFKFKGNTYFCLLLIEDALSILASFIVCYYDLSEISYICPYISGACLFITYSMEYSKAYLSARDENNKFIRELEEKKKRLQ